MCGGAKRAQSVQGGKEYADGSLFYLHFSFDPLNYKKEEASLWVSWTQANMAQKRWNYLYHEVSSFTFKLVEFILLLEYLTYVEDPSVRVFLKISLSWLTWAACILNSTPQHLVLHFFHYALPGLQHCFKRICMSQIHPCIHFNHIWNPPLQRFHRACHPHVAVAVFDISPIAIIGGI